MNQSIDKIAHLLLARKAINSLPAHTKLTLGELHSVLEHNHCGSEAAASILRRCGVSGGISNSGSGSTPTTATTTAWSRYSGSSVAPPVPASLGTIVLTSTDVSSGGAQVLRALHTSSTPTSGTRAKARTRSTRLATAARDLDQ
eukprot:jgi/Psemu1/35927/gm1.35927_g